MVSSLAHSTHYAEPEAAPAPVTLAYAGWARALLGIFLKNLLLTIVTLGIYQFWAKTRVRRFIWGATNIDNEPFEYTGTGKELFVGFLKAMAILFPLLAGVQVAELLLDEEQSGIVTAIQITQTVAIVVLIYAGSYAARRYRMSRTLWRGIRFEQGGSAWRYTGRAALGLLLTAITFGFYFPYLQTSLLRYETQNLRFGSARFEFSGKGGELLGRFAACWVLGLLLFTILVAAFGAAVAAAVGLDALALTPEKIEEEPQRVLYIGLGTMAGVYLAMGAAYLTVGPWYQAKFLRFRAAHTTCEGLRFAMPSATSGRVRRLHAGNLLMTALSIGLLSPFVMQRTARFWCRHLEISGDLDLARVAQADRRPGAGEGLAGFFNVDVG